MSGNLLQLPITSEINQSHQYRGLMIYLFLMSHFPMRTALALSQNLETIFLLKAGTDYGFFYAVCSRRLRRAVLVVHVVYVQEM